MKFAELELRGAFLIEPVRSEDERGFFARSFDEYEFAARGLVSRWVQCSISFNKKKGTLRGMHYQVAPHAETKLVRCTMGSLYDVIIDLRPASPTYKRWFSLELTAENRHILYIPEGFAHGFQTLEDNTEVSYQISEPYNPGFTRGVKYDDPMFAISWSLPIGIIADKDNAHPLWVAAQ